MGVGGRIGGVHFRGCFRPRLKTHYNGKRRGESNCRAGGGGGGGNLISIRNLEFCDFGVIIPSVMNLTNQEILNFVGRIKLSPEKKAACIRQVDALKANVEAAIRAMPNTRVLKVIQAGSFKKGTALKPWGDHPLDVDMVFFMGVEDRMKFDAEELRREIIAVLRRAYPGKPPGDFTNGRKTVGIVFRGSGLEADIVPFIPERANSDYGRQPRKRLGAGEFRTSVKRQLEFIIAAKGRWAAFAPAVRMVKWWRNRKELELPSFAAELLFAHLLQHRRIGAATSIERGLAEFFEFVSANPNMRVGFPEAVGHLSAGAPVIADPTNNANNVLAHVRRDEWGEVVRGANAAFERIHHAIAVDGKTRTVDIWREILDGFNIQEA